MIQFLNWTLPSILRHWVLRRLKPFIKFSVWKLEITMDFQIIEGTGAYVFENRFSWVNH